MSKTKVLSSEIINEISKFVTDKSSNIFINKNEDIFGLLERFCTVVYYPIPEEDNDGFHVKRIVNEREENFVFINTYKYTEKQIFTAAHELGHILDLDEYLITKGLIQKNDFDLQESAMNQFAAQILMPEMDFKIHLAKYTNNKIEFSEQEFINIVLYLMNDFFVPFKAVLLRLSELSIIDYEVSMGLLKNYKDSIPEFIQQNPALKKLGKRNKRKSIKGLEHLLVEADEKECYPDSKISGMRKIFSLKKSLDVKNDKIKISEAGKKDEQ